MKVIKILFLLFTVVNSCLTVAFFIYKHYYLQNSVLYGFLALSIPLILLVSLLLVVLWAFINYKIALIPLIALFSGFESFKETYALSVNNDIIHPDFTILTYNVGTFNLNRFQLTAGKTDLFYVDTTNTYNQNQWLDSVHTDIVCFQEFYTNDLYKSENIISKMVQRGYTYYYMNPIKEIYAFGFFGVVTFSKYPILQGDSVSYSTAKSLNRGIYTDILIQNDTIRVFNIHLHSMSIRFNKADILKNCGKELEETKVKLQEGFEIREEQLNKILNQTQKSPYKTLLCGDFNDTPYSYVYQITKKIYKNAFEESGSGFGYTYNKFPYLLRIDNQFYSNGLKAIYCKTLLNNKSDHLPVEAGYVF